MNAAVTDGRRRRLTADVPDGGDLAAAFGRRLRACRQRAGLSQAELAGPDVSASYISLLESGRRAPTRDVAARLAERLGADVDELLTGVSGPAQRQARMDLAFARLCLGQGDVEQALRTASAVLGTGALEGDAASLFQARLVLAEALERTGHLDQAVRELERLRTAAERRPEELPWLPIVVALSRCYRESGDLQRAVDVAERAHERSEELGLSGLAAHTQLAATLAVAHYERGDLLRAAVLLDELLLSTRDADRQHQAAAYWNAALVASERGRYGEAERLAEQAAARVAEGDDERAVARLKTTRAYILLAQPEPDAVRAQALLEESIPALRLHDSTGAVASATVELARCEVLLGNPIRAREHAEAALEQLGADAALEISRARAVLGDALLALGEGEAARRNLAAAAELLSELGAGRQAAAGWRQLGDALMRSGEQAGAVRAYTAALDAAGLPGVARADVQARA